MWCAERVCALLVMRAASSGPAVASDSRVGLGVTVGVLTVVVIGALGAAFVLYRRLRYH